MLKEIVCVFHNSAWIEQFHRLYTCTLMLKDDIFFFTYFLVPFLIISILHLVLLVLYPFFLLCFFLPLFLHFYISPFSSYQYDSDCVLLFFCWCCSSLFIMFVILIPLFLFSFFYFFFIFLLSIFFFLTPFAGKGKLDFNVFSRIMAHHISQSQVDPEEFRDAFRVFDKDDTGTLR